MDLFFQGGAGDLFVAFNAHEYTVPAPLPPAPAGKEWHRISDTALEPPRDFDARGRKGPFDGYGVQPYSAIMMEARPC